MVSLKDWVSAELDVSVDTVLNSLRVGHTIEGPTIVWHLTPDAKDANITWMDLTVPQTVAQAMAVGYSCL
jgi:hypothetical protein